MARPAARSSAGHETAQALGQEWGRQEARCLLSLVVLWEPEEQGPRGGKTNGWREQEAPWTGEEPPLASNRLSPRSCAASSPRVAHTSPVLARNRGEIRLDPNPCAHRERGRAGVPPRALPSPHLCQLRARAAAALRGPSKMPLNWPQKLISLSPCSPAEAEPRALAQPSALSFAPKVLPMPGAQPGVCPQAPAPHCALLQPQTCPGVDMAAWPGLSPRRAPPAAFPSLQQLELQPAPSQPVQTPRLI